VHRRRLFCCAAALGAFVLSAGASQAATGWTASPATGVAGPVGSFSDIDAWAVDLSGGFAHWNGSTWTQFPGPSGLGVVTAVRDGGATDAWAVGFVSAGYRVSSPQIAHWNGTAWSLSNSVPITGRAATLSGVVSLSSANAWAVGTDGQIALVEHWDGTAWTRVTVPDPNAGTIFGSP
jgi:hypothetical protein